ncbi:MAG: hypothetical protein ABI323_04360 [Solirubrobacteraceae bacterium]
MPHVSSQRFAGLAVVTASTLSLAVAASTASGVSAVAAAGPAKTVTGSIIKRASGTLAPGSKVHSSALAGRTFTDAKHGFALADVGQAQYPAATTNGGKTWKTDGPALHLDAAQAPLVVLNLAAASRRLIFAYGGGQVIDATGDGGKHWYRALFNGLSMAVTRNPQGHLVGFIDTSASGSGPGQTLQYVSKNGGHTWRLNTTVGGS